jgi:hypothetical protein
VEALLLGIAALACPIGMGLMMWMMMGRKRNAAGNADGQHQDGQEQVVELRAEIEELKAERAEQSPQGGR